MNISIVTGAAGGIGEATCDELIRCGWFVLGVDHNTERLKNLNKKHGNKCFQSINADLSHPNFTEPIRQALEHYKNLKGVVNLAGISRGNVIENLTDEDWDESFSVNATAPMKLARLCAPYLRSTGNGSIVNVASPVALIGARKPSYAASKAALIGLTMSLARNLGKDNIRVNALLPGATLTHLTSDWPEEKKKSIASQSFLGRLCQPIEIARVIKFLLSNDASYITGSILDLTAGGMYGH
ncbi:MAG: hypothetical protein RL553_727 [Planctomycetota bacterium]|jgi:NAD(P)-dependent dehydrogenase (short-subunit alcohol dehydrogenase family)